MRIAVIYLATEKHSQSIQMACVHDRNGSTAFLGFPCCPSARGTYLVKRFSHESALHGGGQSENQSMFGTWEQNSPPVLREDTDGESVSESEQLYTA